MDILRKIHKVRQGPTMSVEVYSGLMEKALKQSGLDDAAQLFFYVQGVRTKLKEEVLIAEPVNLMAAMKRAKLIERVKRQLRAPANAAYVDPDQEEGAEVYAAQ